MNPLDLPKLTMSDEAWAAWQEDTGMEHTPMTKQRSPWEPKGPMIFEGYEAQVFHRQVSDGLLVAMVGEEPPGWHLSVSFRDHRGNFTRYPRWDEIVHARDEMLPSDIDFVMHLPKAGDYVALHDTTFHLHEYPDRGHYDQDQVNDMEAGR